MEFTAEYFYVKLQHNCVGIARQYYTLLLKAEKNVLKKHDIQLTYPHPDCTIKIDDRLISGFSIKKGGDIYGIQKQDNSSFICLCYGNNCNDC